MGRPGRSPVIELSNLWIAIGAKTNGLASGIADATRIIGTFAANTKVQIAKINAAWAGFQEVSTMTKLAGGFTLLAAAIALSVPQAIRFEAAFASVTKTVEGTPQELGQIRQEILSMADAMPLAATKIAEVAATAGQLGIATPDVMEFTRVMVMLGTATNLSANEAATAMARFTNIMQIPIQQLPLLAASLVHLGNNSAATESEILTLGLRLAAAGTQLGLSGQQVLALSAAMKSLGITAEVGGSSMSRVLIDMVTAAGPKMDTFARVIGVTRDEFKRLVDERSPEAAGQLILGFVEGLQRIDQNGGSVRKVLQDLGLDSIRLRDTLLRLVSGGDQLAESFGLVSNASVYGGALLQEYGRFAETTASRLEILRNRLTGVAIDVGTPLLGGIASAADAIGDAILAIQAGLAPLAGALMDTFGNGAKIVQAFYSALASPVLSGAMATFAGLAQIIAALIGAFNQLGPAGLVIAALAADLYLVGPASMSAAAGVAAFKASVAEVGVASALAQGGIAALNSALAMAPAAAAIGTLFLLGSAMKDAKSRADELSRSLSVDLAQSLEGGDFDAFSARVGETQDRIRELNNELPDLGFNVGTVTGFFRFLGELLPGVDNSMLNTKAEMEGLKGVLDDPNFGDAFRSNVHAVAYDLGITDQAAFNLIATTGQLSQAQQGGVESFEKVKKAVSDYLAELAGTTKQTQDSTAALLDQQVSVQMLADLYGVSMGTIEEAMARAKVTEADLLDPKKYEEVLGKIDEVVGAWTRLADASGVNVDQIREEQRVTEGLIATQKNLADAFDEVKAARAAAEFPLENLRQATEAYAKATEEYKRGKISLEEYGQKLLDLNSAQAAVAPTVQEGIRMQGENEAAFRKTTSAMGETDAAINDVLVRWGLLTTAEVAKLQVEGSDLLDLARQRIDTLRESVRDDIIAKWSVDSGLSEQQIERLLASGEKWATSEYEARMRAATEGPLRDIADLLVQAGIWDQTEADAYLSADPAAAFDAIDAVLGQAETWGNSNWVGILTADNSNALARSGGAQAAARDYADGDYMAILSADNSDGMSKANQVVGAGRRFADGSYQGRYTADNSDAIARAEQATGAALKFGSQRPRAVLEAQDNASGVISGALAKLGAFVSKTITLTTVTRTVGASTVQVANGMVFRSYGAGGFENHQAQVARGQWPVRIWAEPETGGEAYIPLSPVKRARSTRILDTVAKDFGYNLVPMASGGIMRDQASLAAVLAAAGWRAMGENRYQRERLINIHAPISVNLTGTQGADPQEIARMVDVAARRALSQAGRQLANTRR